VSDQAQLSGEEKAMKTIVILKPAPTSTFDAIGAVLPQEERTLWAYLSTGECRSIHYIETLPGAVLLEFETATLDRPKQLVEAFPLVAGGLHLPEYHALAPYTGLFDPKHGFAPNPPDAWERKPQS
jgi:hypothetical protein